jgi:hypothetical protein
MPDLVIISDDSNPTGWSLPARLLAGLSVLGLLCWPFFSFGVLFAGDPPFRKGGQGLATLVLTILTWGFGPLCFVAWFGYKKLRKRAMQEPARLVVWMLPLSVPFYYLWFFGTF